MFLSLISSQDIKVSELDRYGSFIADAEHLSSLRPKVLVINTINEEDRRNVSSPYVITIPCEGSLSPVTSAIHHMGEAVDIVDYRIIHEAIKVAEAEAAENAALNDGSSWPQTSNVIGGQLNEYFKDNQYAAIVNLTAEDDVVVKDKCSALFIEEKNALAQIGERLTTLIDQTLNQTASPLVIALNPSRVTDCMRHEGQPDVGVAAVANELMTMVNTLTTAALSIAGNSSISITLYYGSEKPHFIAESLAASPISAIEIRRLQVTEGEFPIPYSITLWLCIGMSMLLVSAVLPLLWLSNIEDPVIDTKLFSTAH